GGAGLGDGRSFSLTIGGAPARSATFIRYVLVAEMVENFMKAQGVGWVGKTNEGAEGEGMSRFLSVVAFGPAPSQFLVSNFWLKSPRTDYVNDIDNTNPLPGPRTGCSTLFLWYLYAQLGFTVNQIAAAGAPDLGQVWRNLTGEFGD